VSSACVVVTSQPSAFPPSPARQWARILVVTVLLVVLGATLLGPLWWEFPAVGAGCLLFVLLFGGTGAILWDEPGQRRTGGMLVAAAVLWPLGWSEEWARGPLPLISGIAAYAALSLAARAMLRYPDPALMNRAERVFVRVLTVVLIAVVVAQDLTMRPEWKDYDPGTPWPTLYPDRALNQAVITVGSVLHLLLIGGFAAFWAVRVRRIDGLDRRLLAPMAVAAPAAVLAAVSVPLVQLFDVHAPLRDQVFAVQAAVLATVPLAFCAGVLRRRLGSVAVLTMIRQVQRRPTPEAVQAALRSALRDDSLRVLFRAPDLDAYVDERGIPTPVHAAAGRLVLPVRSATGDDLARIDVDAAVVRHPRVLADAVAAGGLALENAQLQAALRGRLDQVRADRRDAVAAGVSARRRVERDLHDGAQQRLLALRLVLAAADGDGLPDTSRSYLHGLNRELGRALEELRDLARGIHPALLSQVGLAAAVEAYAQRMPAEIDLDLPAERLPAAAEETAYTLIVCVLDGLRELTDRVRAEVRGHLSAGVLTVEIQTATDPGAAPQPAHLQLAAEVPGMLDRIRALGGDLMVSALPPGGALLVAAVPCVVRPPSGDPLR